MTDNQASPTEPEDRDPTWGSKKTLVPAVAVLGLVALMGIWVGVSSGDDHASPTAQTGPPPAASTAASPPAGTPGASSVPSTGNCPALADTSQAQPDQQAFAGDLTWRPFGSYLLPLSKQAGPAVVEGEVARCYAHTPRGAVVALANSSIRSANAKDWRAVVNEEVLPGAERDTYSSFVAASRSDATLSPSSTGRIAGFNVVSYTSDTAVVDMVLEFPVGGYKSVLLTAVWSGGDWRQKMTVDGQQSASYQPLRTLAGYVPFAADH